MKVYISGAITGTNMAETKLKFGIVDALLKRTGFDVVNPMDISNWGLSWKTYLALAKVTICSGDVDAIYMLEGWRESVGSRLERKWAKEQGLMITYQNTDRK